MYIKVEFSDSSLWGDVDPEAEGYDAKASAAQFVEELENHLAAEYPDAEVEIIHGINDRHSVDGFDDDPEAVYVGEIINKVWQDQPWEVESR